MGLWGKFIALTGLSLGMGHCGPWVVYPTGQARMRAPTPPMGDSPYHPCPLGKSGEWGLLLV